MRPWLKSNAWVTQSNFPLQQTVSVAQAASVLAVMTTPAVSVPALAVMEPVAHVTRKRSNATKIAAQESPEPQHCIALLITSRAIIISLLCIV